MEFKKKTNICQTRDPGKLDIIFETCLVSRYTLTGLFPRTGIIIAALNPAAPQHSSSLQLRLEQQQP
jgi:hypothetical protein